MRSSVHSRQKEKVAAVLLAFIMAFSVCADIAFADEEGGQDGEQVDAVQTEIQAEMQQESQEEEQQEQVGEPEQEQTETEVTEPVQPVVSEPVKLPAWKSPSGKHKFQLQTCCDSDGNAFNLTVAAGQKLFGYDTLQGACANKGYGYFVLYNRLNNRCKIVKVKLSTMTVTKVSASMPIKHANGITYNTKKNIIVVANSTPLPKRLTVISPKTLKIKYHKNISMSGKVKGMTKSQRKKFKGVGSIAYNAKYNCYICNTRGDHDLLFLNSKLKPTKRVKPNKMLDMVHQDMDSYKDCIMICQSFKGKKEYNAVTFYNMKGRYIARFTYPKKNGMELETILHDGRQFYLGFYQSLWWYDENEELQIDRVNSFFSITNL